MAAAVIGSPAAYEAARLCLMDASAARCWRWRIAECRKLLGPVVPGAVLPGGARVPGTACELDPIQAAFNLGAMIRWLDYNDTWLAAEWGHPSDNLGAILATADWLVPPCRGQVANLRTAACACATFSTAMIKAYEIQGVLSLENAFNRLGLDHVILVRVAGAAVAAALLGGTQRADSCRGLRMPGSTAVCCAPIGMRPTPARASPGPPATPPAAACGWRLWALRGEMGYPAPSAPTWGFSRQRSFAGRRFSLPRPLGSYVMENILFKIAFRPSSTARPPLRPPSHSTPQVAGAWDQIAPLIDRNPGVGPADHRASEARLANPADRDHCLQYMVAVALLHGTLTAEHYADDYARNPRIDACGRPWRSWRMPRYSRDYLDPTSARLPTRCRCSSLRQPSRGSRSNIRWDIGGGGPRDCRSWQRSFATIWPHACPPSNAGPSWTSSATCRGWSRSPWTSSWTCGCTPAT